MIQIRRGHIRYAGVENGDACFCGKKNLLMTIYPNRPWRMVVSSVAARGGSKYMIKVHEGDHASWSDHPYCFIRKDSNAGSGLVLVEEFLKWLDEAQLEYKQRFCKLQDIRR